MLALRGGDPVRSTPFPYWPVFGEKEETALLHVLRSGNWWYGDKVRSFEERYARFQDARYGVSCSNGTVALELALRALGISAGDEVLVPAYTFIATATAVLTVNAKPVFVDVSEENYNIDLDHAETLVNENTKAIIVVHFAGLPVDIDRVETFARRRGVLVVEDAAHAWGSQWKGMGVGALLGMGTFSFQMSKNITSGEGGIILTNHKDVADLARSYTHCGRTAANVWYQHAHVGGNYRITEFQAALLLEQLARLPEQTRTRELNALYLNERLSAIPGIRLPQHDDRVTRRSYHIYMFRYLRDEFAAGSREIFLNALRAEGIPASQGYLTPVYGNNCFQDLRSVPGLERCSSERFCDRAAVDFSGVCCPVAEKLCREEAVWLPHALLLGDRKDMESVVAAIEKLYAHREELEHMGHGKGKRK